MLKCQNHLKIFKGKISTLNILDNDPLYIDINSNHPNHPPNITKKLPDYISKQTIKLSSGEQVFNSKKELNNNAVKNRGYKQNIKFKHNIFAQQKRNYMV